MRKVQIKIVRVPHITKSITLLQSFFNRTHIFIWNKILDPSKKTPRNPRVMLWRGRFSQDTRTRPYSNVTMICVAAKYTDAASTDWVSCSSPYRSCSRVMPLCFNNYCECLRTFHVSLHKGSC